jgi:hypothetical protein
MRSNFSLRMLDRSFQTPLTIPDLAYTAEKYSQAAIGGPRRATVGVQGEERALWELLEWLRAPVEILDRRKDAVWWGYLDGVEVAIGAIRVRVTLDGMANRVAVAYAFVEPGSESAGARATTAWAQDDDSLATYGTREVLAQLGSATVDQAETAREALLEMMRYPQPQIEVQRALLAGGKKSVSKTMGGSGKLHLRGWWNTLDWKYFAQTAGKEAHEADGNGTQDLGRVGGNQRAAQGYQLVGSGWEAAAVKIKIRKQGAPSDDVIVELCADSSGTPGTVLVSSSAAATSIPVTMNWHTFNFAPLMGGGYQILQPSTTYWLVVRRSGAVNNDNYYVVDVDEGLAYPRGVMRLYNGSGWVARDPDADMNFQVLGGRETTLQIEDIVTANGQFITGVVIEERSNLISNQYRRGDTTALYEIEELLRSGNNYGRRLLARINRNRELVVSLEPERDSYNAQIYIKRDGAVENQWGDPYYAATCPVGQWALLKDVIPSSLDLGRMADPSMLFIEEAEYDAQRDIYTPWARGQETTRSIATRIVEG